MQIQEKEIVSLPISTINCDERLRVVDIDAVEMLQVSIAEFGLLSPILVSEADRNGMHSLIAGAHRLEACRSLGMQEIEAQVLSVNKLQARILEIDENLFRLELTQLDRATFLAERKEIYEAMHPETKNGNYIRETKNEKIFVLGGEDKTPTFSVATAQKLGFDRRTIEIAIARSKCLAVDVKKRIATTYIARKGSLLDALAKLPPSEQREIVEIMLSNEEEISVADAKRISLGVPPPVREDDQEYQNLMKAWRRAGSLARDQFIEFLSKEGQFVRLQRAV